MITDRMPEIQTTPSSGWRKPIPSLNTDSHETRIAALEADIEELRKTLEKVMKVLTMIDTWVGD